MHLAVRLDNMTRVKQVLAKASKNARKKERQHLGPLRDLVVQPSTAKRYRHAVSSFFLWCQSLSHVLPSSLVEFDLLVADYINALWEEGEGRSLAANVLSGLQHYRPFLRRNLPCAWRLIGAWGRRELPARADPVSILVLEALCGLAFMNGRADAAVLMYLAFHCILRTGEFLRLTAADFAISSDHSSGVVNLGETKSGQRQGAKESVTLDDPMICKMVGALLLNKLPGDLLLVGSHGEFRSFFKGLCDTLQLQSWNFKPYSLRRGGATHHFRTQGQLSRTIVRGRWNSARAARVYINDGIAALAAFQFPQKTLDTLKKYQLHFKHRTAKAR